MMIVVVVVVVVVKAYRNTSHQITGELMSYVA